MKLELINKRRCMAFFSTVTLILLRASAHCQTNSPYPADNSVWKISTTKSNAHSYIDASVLSGSDICAQINTALVQVANASSFPDYNSKAVVDARGIYINLSCSGSTSNPWTTWTSGAPGATVLLPAATITVTSTWTLPPNTQVIGAGPSATTIVGSGLSPIIAMGNSSLCGNNDCNGVAVEHLTLSGGAIGIQNTSSQEQNYVNDVSMTGITDTGLKILGHDYSTTDAAVNSGPYSNIYFSGSGTCVNILGTYGTRGIHGLTCIHTGSATGSAILLDGSNNTIEDVFISNYSDGVVIGSQLLYSQNNVLLNIQGDSTIANSVVHICGPVDHTPACPANYMPLVQPSDITLMGISSAANKSTSYTVQDDMLGANLQSLSTADPYVGLYVLGEGVAGTPAHPGLAEPAARFTTSQSVPTWYVGTTPPTSSGCQNGSLFSVISGSSTPSLSLCVSGQWGGFSAGN